MDWYQRSVCCSDQSLRWHHHKQRMDINSIVLTDKGWDDEFATEQFFYICQYYGSDDLHMHMISNHIVLGEILFSMQRGC